MASETEPQLSKNLADQAPASSATAAGVPHEPVGLNGWFAELKRRRVVRTLVGYGIASFAVLQIIEPVMHGLHWPETVLSYVVVALGAGFPVVITLAWIFDVKAGRIERTASAAAGTGLRGVRLALLLLGIGVLAAAPGLFYYFVLRSHTRGPNASGPGGNVAIIAVLPFASLGSSEENAYFADGFHDELLRQMGRIGDLRVISRTSVMQYKNGARNLREIAEALGVSSVVEGSVQRAGNRVRVEARLIDARNDLQIWSDRYDRDLTDVFGIQTAVAEEIAGALHARLSTAQKAQIQRKPTENAEAYDLYLRALEYENRLGYQPDNLEIAERLYRQAIQADPSFALARARLALVKLNYWWAAGASDSVAEEARDEAEQSLRLQPDLPEGHLALGLYYYWRHRDYDRALKELEIARPGVPTEAIDLMGWVLRRQGKYDEAIRYQQEALRLDPRSLDKRFQLADSFIRTRRYEDADGVLDRVLAIAPDFTAASMEKAFLQEAWKGETSLAKKILRETRGRLDPRGRVGAQDWIIQLLLHNPREALPFLDYVDSDSIIGRGSRAVPKALLYAAAHEALGDADQARKEYETALPLLAAEVEKNPSRPFQRSLLARAYAGLGRKEDALREANRAIEIRPISKDHVGGAGFEIERAAVEARVGETNAAIEHIRYLLSIPCLLSPALLRIDPTWAPLRADSRFRKLAELE